MCGPKTFARVSRTERSLSLASTHDGIQFPIRDISVLFVEPSIGDIVVWGTYAIYD